MTLAATKACFNFYRRGLTGHSIADRRVLDFGCGAVHPFDMSAVFWLNGASSCFALDMEGSPDLHSAALSLFELLTACAQDFTPFLLPSTDSSLFMERLKSFDMDRLGAGEFYRGIGEASLVHVIGRIEDALIAPRSIDIAVSNTVIEHVAHLDSVAAHFAFLLARDGVMYHVVDYTDHGVHADPTLNYWSFMTNGSEVPDTSAGGDMNQLRNSEVESIFRNAGFDVKSDHLIRQPPPDFVLANLTPKFRDISKDDLELITTGLRLIHGS